MSRKGNCWNNAISENFFGLVKTDMLNHLHFKIIVSAELAIFDYINVWYSPNRIYFKLVYVSPNEFEAANHGQNKTKLNSAEYCKKSQLIIEFTNLVAEMS